jgi:transposase-like protein
MWWVTTQKNGASALGLQRVLGLKSYETAWAWLHKFRRAMVRPGRDLLTGRVEVDESYVGGPEEGLPGRLNLEKALVVVAAEEDGAGIGRIRLRQIVDASAESLIPFVRESVAAGSTVHTDGWQGYLPLKSSGYQHEVTYLKGNTQAASDFLDAGLWDIPRPNSGQILSNTRLEFLKELPAVIPIADSQAHRRR